MELNNISLILVKRSHGDTLQIYANNTQKVCVIRITNKDAQLIKGLNKKE